ncbi:hypothetical protein SK128_011300 [Halocaridina rubra]|uniref:Sulfotransferase domain-containing protein n=1 Tax=Halocaridina rubra TaxID=373956 RepID=A0AAN8XAU3_HALRR
MERDPRPVMQSRQNLFWCRNEPDCGYTNNVCGHYFQDLKEAQKLKKEYPDRFKFVQYERLSLHTEITVKEIWKFLHLKLRDETLAKVHKLTSAAAPPSNPYDTNRNTVSHTFYWRKTMSFEAVEKIQNACQQVLSMLGLRSFSTREELHNTTVSAFLPH